jgi:hypothetical protein
MKVYFINVEQTSFAKLCGLGVFAVRKVIDFEVTLYNAYFMRI